ncbi:lipopolysaccharide biosynthesis protein [Tetragenococcus halophilus]|uniref:lipopolysaccharide biosynthesis protein n=1 Tax=Tetragenococcus halophilus TaxID=51669 RepID=UPI00300FF2F4
MSDNQSIEKKMLTSTKWSTLGEVAAKLVRPISNMVLARLLVPSDFGVVATITMITSFAEMFKDAGFQKYLIQADISKKDLPKYANVAFWTNLLVSVIIWAILLALRSPLSILLGDNRLVQVLPIATVSIVISSLSMIQIGLFRRSFLFKRLFVIRVVGLIIPLLVTIPLAFLGFKFWAIIIGDITLALVNAIVLTYLSNWKPSFYYKFNILKQMFSFSMWTLFEGISIWLTGWIDSFLIGTRMSQQKLGVYKTSTTNVNSIMSLITASITPVLFSGLSRLKDDDEKYFSVFLNMQRLMGMFVIPLGIGIFTFRDLTTRILLGKGWGEATLVIGTWALSSALMIIFGNLFSEVYRSKGQPKLSVIAQCLHLVFLIPLIIWAVSKGFEFLVIVRSLARLQFILVHLIIIKSVFGYSILTILTNLRSIFISAILMGGVGYLTLKISQNIIVQFIWIIVCVIVYFGILSLFKDTKKDIKSFYDLLRKKVRSF